MDLPSSEKITVWRQSSASLEMEMDLDDNEESVLLLELLPEDEDKTAS